MLRGMPLSGLMAQFPKSPSAHRTLIILNTPLNPHYKCPDPGTIIINMSTKLDRLRDLFIQKKIIDNFDEIELVEISKCQSLENLERILLENQLGEDFRLSLAEILLDSTNINQEMEVVEINTELEDLIEIAQNAERTKEHFSQKYFKVFKLKSYLANNHATLSFTEVKHEDTVRERAEAMRKLKEMIIKEKWMSDSIEEAFGKATCSMESDYGLIERIEKQIMPLDIDLLERYVQRSSKTGSKIEGKSGITFIGETGAGKSTIILGLLGHEMVQREWEGLPWITPTKIMDYDLDIKNIVAVPSVKSVTKNATAIRVRQHLIDKTKEEIYFVDTPGFNDTRGSIMDIANTFGTSKAVKSLKSARFVIMLSGKDERSRSEGIIRMVNNISQLFQNYKQVEGSVVFVFNRYATSDIETMNNKLKFIWKQLPATSRENKNVMAIFSDMISKTSKDRQILVFDPLNKTKDYMKTFLNKILQSPSAQNPQTFFSVCYGDRATDDIRKQVGILKDFCLRHFQCGEYNICKYYVEKLQKLAQIMRKNENPYVIDSAIKEIERNISKKMDENCVNTIKAFNQLIDFCSLTSENIIEYSNQVREAEFIYKSLGEHLEIPNIEQRLESNMNDKINPLVQSFKENVSFIEGKTIECLVTLLNGSGKKQELKEIKTRLQKQLGDLNKKYKEHIKNMSFNASVQDYNKYKSILNIIDHLNMHSNNTQAVLLLPIQNVLIADLTNKFRFAQGTVSDYSKCSPQDLNKIRDISDYFNRLKGSVEYLRNIDNRVEVNKKIDEFKTLVTENITRVFQSMEMRINQKENYSKEEVEENLNLYRIRNSLVEIPHLKAAIGEIAQGIEKRVNSILENSEKVMADFSKEIEEEVSFYKLKFKLLKLDSAISNLSKIRGFLVKPPEFSVQEIIHKIEYFLKNYLQQVCEIFNRRSSLSDSTNQKQMKGLSNIQQVILAFDKNSNMFSSPIFQNPGITKVLDEIKESFKQIFEDKIKDIEMVVEEFERDMKEKSSTGEFVLETMKVKEIESCLALTLLGENVFMKQKDRKEKFSKLYQILVNRIKDWKFGLYTSISKKFESLGKLKAENVKEDAQLLKRMIENKVLIGKQPEINKTFERMVDVSEISIEGELETLSKTLKDEFKAFEISHDCIDNLSILGQKCRYLNVLDVYLSYEDKFSVLFKKIKNVEAGFADSEFDKLKYASEIRNYEDMSKYLEKILHSENHQERVGEAISLMVGVFKDLVRSIKDSAKTIGEGSHALIHTLDLFEEFIQAKTILSQGKLKSNELIKDIIENSEDIYKEIQGKIDVMYQTATKQIEAALNRNYIEKAYVLIQGLKKTEWIQLRVQKKGEVKEAGEVSDLQSQIYTRQINEKIKEYQEKYLTGEQMKWSSFRDDYEAFFDSERIACPDLEFIKKTTITKINSLIEDKLKEMLRKEYFTNHDLVQIKEFVFQLPQELRSKRNCISLMNQASQKFQKWEEQKKELKEEIERTDVFTKDGAVNLKILNYYKDPTADKITKKIILNKMENHLRAKLKVYSKDGLTALVKFLNECPDVRISPEIESEKALQDMKEVFSANTRSANENILKEFRKDMLDLEQHVLDIDNRFTEAEIVAYRTGFIKALITFSSIMDAENLKKLVFPATREEIEQKEEDLIINIVKYYKKTKTLLNNLKCIFDMNEAQGMHRYHIREIGKIRVIENSVQEFIATIKGSPDSVLTTNLLKRLEAIPPHFIISEYRKKVDEIVVLKYQLLDKFSLKDAKMMSFMDETELDRDFKQKHSWLKYITFIYIPLLESLGMTETIERSQSISCLESKLQIEAQELKSQVLQYAKKPIIQENIIQSIRCKNQVLERYSLIFQGKNNIAQVFNQYIKEYHTELENMTKNILNKQKEEDERNKKEAKEKIDKLEKEKLTEIKQETAKHEKKLETLRIDFDNEAKGRGKSDLESLEKSYECDVESEKNLHAEQIKRKNNQYTERIDRINSEVEECSKVNMKVVAENYEQMVSMTECLMPTNQLKNKNDSLLKEVKKKGQKKWMKYLLDGLKGISTTTAGSIIANNVELKQLLDTYFSKNIESLSIEQVVEDFKKENPDVKESFKSELQKKSEMCLVHYNHWIQEYKDNQQVRDKLIKEVKNHDKNNMINEVSVHLLAKIFAVWTIITSKVEDGVVIYNYKPHPAQIIACMLLLGLVNIKECKGFGNRFAEIKTGQGKSLILAVTSTYFALHGFQVDCVCYSQHLSIRDRESFQNLFSTLDVDYNVKYGTFNQLTESYTNNNQLKLRKCCDQLIQKGKITYNSEAKIFDGKVKGKVLLIDEADVFFIDQFYGNFYAPSAELKSSEVKNLFTFIWNNRNNSGLKKLIISSAELQKVIQVFPKFKDLIENHVNGMIGGVKQYQHQYQVMNGRIAYKNQDGYSDKISYGYKTVFAYFNEYSKKRIVQIPPMASSIDIALCEISFAQLPKMYQFILGVSGSLNNLSDCKKKIMRDEYQIKDNYMIPSVYKKPTRYDEGYRFVPHQEHSAEIIKNLQHNHDRRRPVMIFFDTLSDASDFYDKEIYKPFRGSTVILSEKHNADERKRRVMRAMSEGKISLITRAFARGIDFIIYESNVITLGGAHMIVTFTIEEKSEEMQILGRVARQGDPGSSVFIISDQNIKDKLGLQSKNLQKLSQTEIQNDIDEAREKKAVEKHDKIKIQLVKCKAKHDQAQKLFEHIRIKNQQSVLQYLIKLNMLPEIAGQLEPVRTILAIDATGSMSSAIQQTRITLSVAFEKIYQILKNNKVEDGFEMQIIAYRNYDCKEDQLFTVTPFENKPEPLIVFVKNLSARGGYGMNEALQTVYDYSLGVENLKQLIVIADAPANTPEETIQKRASHRETYWATTHKFRKQLNRDLLLDELKNKKIPIQSLSIGAYSKGYFEQVSRETSGKHEVFEPSSLGATAQLTNFISLSILDKVGERTGMSQKLMDSYRKTYKV